MKVFYPGKIDEVSAIVQHINIDLHAFSRSFLNLDF